MEDTFTASTASLSCTSVSGEERCFPPSHLIGLVLSNTTVKPLPVELEAEVIMAPRPQRKTLEELRAENRQLQIEIERLQARVELRERQVQSAAVAVPRQVYAPVANGGAERQETADSNRDYNDAEIRQLFSDLAWHLQALQDEHRESAAPNGRRVQVAEAIRRLRSELDKPVAWRTADQKSEVEAALEILRAENARLQALRGVSPVTSPPSSHAPQSKGSSTPSSSSQEERGESQPQTVRIRDEHKERLIAELNKYHGKHQRFEAQIRKLKARHDRSSAPDEQCEAAATTLSPVAQARQFLDEDERNRRALQDEQYQAAALRLHRETQARRHQDIQEFNLLAREDERYHSQFRQLLDEHERNLQALPDEQHEAATTYRSHVAEVRQFLDEHEKNRRALQDDMSEAAAVHLRREDRVWHHEEGHARTLRAVQDQRRLSQFRQLLYEQERNLQASPDETEQHKAAATHRRHVVQFQQFLDEHEQRRRALQDAMREAAAVHYNHEVQDRRHQNTNAQTQRDAQDILLKSEILQLLDDHERNLRVSPDEGREAAATHLRHISHLRTIVAEHKRKRRALRTELRKATSVHRRDQVKARKMHCKHELIVRAREDDWLKSQVRRLLDEHERNFPAVEVERHEIVTTPLRNEANNLGFSQNCQQEGVISSDADALFTECAGVEQINSMKRYLLSVCFDGESNRETLEKIHKLHRDIKELRCAIGFYEAAREHGPVDISPLLNFRLNFLQRECWWLNHILQCGAQNATGMIAALPQTLEEKICSLDDQLSLVRSTSDTQYQNGNQDADETRVTYPDGSSQTSGGSSFSLDATFPIASHSVKSGGSSEEAQAECDRRSISVLVAAADFGFDFSERFEGVQKLRRGDWAGLIQVLHPSFYEVTERILFDPSI